MTDGPETLIDALKASFAAALQTQDGEAPAVALLWPDPEGQWQALIDPLRTALSHLFVLGDYQPDDRQGPVIWLKCIVDRTLPEVAVPTGQAPILYLPHVGRAQLRAAGACPPALRPLVELQYRGAVWHQRNGRDWSVEAFLTSEHGTHLDMALDRRTREAVLRALPLLAKEALPTLRGRRLDADDFDRLAVGDEARDLLLWMGSPRKIRGQYDTDGWQSFRNLCVRTYGFDPEVDGAQTAGDLLIRASSKAWNKVWHRFCEAPKSYPGIPRLLRVPLKTLFPDQKRHPAFNEEREDALRRELEAVIGLPHGQACDRVLRLERAHNERRALPWAVLGESPYAIALEPLTRLALSAHANGPACAHGTGAG